MTQEEANEIIRSHAAGDGWCYVEMAGQGDGTVTLYINGEQVPEP